MQVKIGPTTLEQKVIEFTHESQIAGTLQGIAQGATSFIGVQYRKLTGHVNSRYIEQHSKGQIPGERLKVKLKSLKESFKKNWEDKKETVQEEIRSEFTDDTEQAD